MKRAAFVAVVTALATAAGFAANTPAVTATGLTGKVLRGPTSPVCQVDKPCYAPFKGTLIFTALGASPAQSVRTQSDAGGRYRLRLKLGRYRVTTGVRSRVGGIIHPSVVTVAGAGFRQVNFVIDTGIR